MSRTRSKRRLVAAAAAALCGCALSLGLAAGGGAAVRVDPTELYVNYTAPTAVQVTLGGTIIRSGGSIPAGLYTVIVYDDGYNGSPRSR